MKVKWHGEISTERKLNGGGPQGATFGIWEYLAQSNDSAESVESNYKFKFVDDLTVLEKINLLTIGLTSFNSKFSVPSDIPESGLFINSKHLQSQNFLNQIQQWTNEKKMILNQKKTKVIIFNYTNNYQFSTRLKLKDENLEIVKESKLLGVMVTDDLKWDKNTQYLINKAYKKMQILRKAVNFRAPIEDRKIVYISYVRNALEQACQVWNSRLTQQNIEDLERVQKSALRIILNNQYESYNDALEKVNLETLEERRKFLCLKFANNSLQGEKSRKMFPLNQKKQNTFKGEKFKVKYAKTERLRISAIPYMQRLLNEHQG